jgi:S-adenosylmethionine hydrolase
MKPLTRRVGPILLLLALWPALTYAQEANPPTIVFMTDFGIVDDSVAICRGVMYEIEPRLRIVDLTHQVTPYAIADGARFLYCASPYYPAGTVFVVVIDPGVGSNRNAIVAKSKRGHYFVLPDNGLLTMIADRDGIDGVREITNSRWMIGPALSSTFHGRDIFSPVGAHLAHGEDWTQVGPEVPADGLVRLKLQPAKLGDGGLSGAVIATDGPYGNLITNISAEEFQKLGYAHGERVGIVLGNRKFTLPFVRTFSDVEIGRPLLYIDSRGRLSFAVNQRSFAATYGIKSPASLLIEKKK